MKRREFSLGLLAATGGIALPIGASAQGKAGSNYAVLSKPAPVDAQPIIASLSQREKVVLVIYLKEGVLGVSDVVKLTGAAQSSVHNTLKNLEGIGLLKMSGKKRMLTNLGIQVAQLL